MGRVATKDGVMTRVRPRSYYRPSKQTYSRLFSEIEQAVDMSLVKLQRIIFMEDLTGGLIVRHSYSADAFNFALSN